MSQDLQPAATPADADFSDEQKRFLEGFASGVQIGRVAGTSLAASLTGPQTTAPVGPDAAHLAAMTKVEAAGKKLNDQEKWKRAEHPFDAYARLKTQAKSGQYPKPEDNFRWRFHGLFYVAPAQNSFMCRLRIPNGILTAAQLSGIAHIAETKAGGFAHVTTRANLQMREITAVNAPDVVEALSSLGLIPRGSGADNIRNVTGSATAGIDPHELIDTRPHARDWHYHVLNDRSLSALPRKFNVAFDGGSALPTLEETNDISFQAIELRNNPSGPYYLLKLGGITGHKDLARPTHVIVAPDDTTALADAVLRVYITLGNRTDRAKSRLKYVLDELGIERFLTEVETVFGRKLTRVEDAAIAPRPLHDRRAHIGAHAQKQPGLNWFGVWTPLGRMTVAQMRALSGIAAGYGDGDIRLTVWQNLILSGIKDEDLPTVTGLIKDAGFATDISNARAGLVACTGNQGCKFAAADTKGHALQIADHLDAKLMIDQPVNIHLTGCHHSCAQHYVGDIGLIAAKVSNVEEDETVEGYHIYTGGGFGTQAKIGRLVYENVKASDAPRVIEGLLRAYMHHRATQDESFHGFTNRLEPETLKHLAEEASP